MVVAAENKRIEQLVESAERAHNAGRTAEAAELLAQAESLAPSDALVLNALGLQAMRSNDLPAARQHLERAAGQRPHEPVLWLNLAQCRRMQSDVAGELAALDQALALQPRFYPAVLQKATWLERQGKRKKAAKLYEVFLHIVPPPAQRPPQLMSAIEYAQKIVDADRNALAQVIETRLVKAAARDASRGRFDHCIDALLGRRRIFTSQPTLMHFPKLAAIEFFERRDFPWLGAFEDATAAMRAELLAVLADPASDAEIVPYVDYPSTTPLDQWRELNRSRQWSAYYLLKDGVKIEKHLARCPRTAALLAAAPLADVPGQAPTAFFSMLQPHTRIPPHTGVTNTRLVVHVPLVLPAGCRFRVGSETREWELGKAWIFDDTIEHEAWNDSDEPRYILIIDVWNPLLTEAEKEWVRIATAAIAEYRHE
jgi:aspartyl/asparaginyl beta-hydroxylase (cupin superfamily)/Tfp pilus assembly protein PilF